MPSRVLAIPDHGYAQQIALAGGIGLAFKIFARTPFHRAKDVDLHSDVAFFDALTEYYDNEKEGKPVKLTDKILYHLF